MFMQLFVVVACVTLRVVDAAQQPALALFDAERNETLSVTGWRDIDLGVRSSLYAGSGLAHVYALRVTVGFNNHATDEGNDAKVRRELFLIPFCRPLDNASDAPHVGGCHLWHYRGALLLRFRGGWERRFVTSLQKDSVLGPRKREAVRRFVSVMGGGNITLPFPFDGVPSMVLRGSEWGPRYEEVAGCSDITEECFQTRLLTYTASYKNIPLDLFTGRILYQPIYSSSWNTPWMLRLDAVMPHDSSSEVEIVAVLSSPEEPLSFRLWLVASPLGYMCLWSMCWVVFLSFIVGTKELAVRSSMDIPLQERRLTSLFEATEANGEGRFPYRRIAAALQEAAAELWSAVLPILSAIGGLLRRCPRFRSEEGIVLGPAPDDGEAVGGFTAAAGNGREGGLSTHSSEEDDEDEGDVCRICRCSKPVDDLFSPCACAGTSKYVHRLCLEKWRESTTNAEHRRVCAECKTPYSLVLEQVSLSPYGSSRSLVCVPAFYAAAHFMVRIFSMVCVLCFGGYYLKGCMYIATGFDEGVMWTCHHLYHWVLGVYFVAAFCINLRGLEYLLMEFTKAWQQILALLLSVALVEVPLNYVGQVFLFLFFHTNVSLEVSYALGIVMAVVCYVQVLPFVYRSIDSFMGVREVVAPRAVGVV